MKEQRLRLREELLPIGILQRARLRLRSLPEIPVRPEMHHFVLLPDLGLPKAHVPGVILAHREMRWKISSHGATFPGSLRSVRNS